MPNPPEKFVTVHRPKQHSAGTTLLCTDLVEPKPTEVELVRALYQKGICIKAYEYYDNRGNEKFSVICWRRIWKPG